MIVIYLFIGVVGEGVGWEWMRSRDTLPVALTTSREQTRYGAKVQLYLD